MSDNSIQKDPSNPKIFTNRAFARIKLQLWDACIDDCIKAIELEKGNMKGYFYLAQAQLALNHPNEAYTSALSAYEKCLETFSASTQAVSNLVLQAKKQKWESREKERVRQRSGLLRELEEGLMRKKKEDLQSLKFRMLDYSDEQEEKADIELDCRKKIEELRTVFAIADPKNLKRRVCTTFREMRQENRVETLLRPDQEVPDYLIDNISFTVMHDPVVTKTGNTYDRSTVLEHLKRSHTDPLTREPLHLEDLRPNIALKQACEEFLAENGWAVDW